MGTSKVTKTTDVKVDDTPVDATTVKVKSPFGAVTEVPAGIVDVLLASGYSKSK